MALLVVAILLNSGCILTSPKQWVHNGFKVGPNYGRPPAPVAAEWIQANDPSVQSHRIDDWWEVFGDPTLNSLIVTAYNQNPTLRIAGTRVLEARAGQAIAVGNIFPQTQQATAAYARVNLNPNMPIIGSILNTLPQNQRSAAFSKLVSTASNARLGLDTVGPHSQEHRVEQVASLDASVEDYDAAC